MTFCQRGRCTCSVPVLSPLAGLDQDNTHANTWLGATCLFLFSETVTNTHFISLSTGPTIDLLYLSTFLGQTHTHTHIHQPHPKVSETEGCRESNNAFSYIEQSKEAALINTPPFILSTRCQSNHFWVAGVPTLSFFLCALKLF